jgi:3-oxoacyl-[acyl-carrier protein] reductase
VECRLDGRVALVTGGSKGLGLAMAKELAVSGAELALVARNVEDLQAAKTAIGQLCSARVECYSCDVADGEQIKASFNQITADFAAVDILINNAGSSMGGPFETMSDEDWQFDIDLKVMAAVRFSRLAMPGMRERQWGRILNTLNVYAKTPIANTLPTTATRAAGMAITKVLAHEGAADNILVNGLCIGVMESEQLTGQSRGEKYDAHIKRTLDKVLGQIPMGRIGRAEELANLACFLCSDKASYITGTAINVDGGLAPAV